MVSHVKKIMWIVEIIYLVNFMNSQLVIVVILILIKIIGLISYKKYENSTCFFNSKYRSEKHAKINIDSIGIRG